MTAPQHPKNAMKNMIEPVAIKRLGIEKQLLSKNVSYDEYLALIVAPTEIIIIPDS